MKILQIAPPWLATPPKKYGGTELIIHQLCENLIKQGHEVTLFATGDSKTSAGLNYIFDQGLYDKGVDWNSALGPLVHYQQAFKLFEEGGYDIVHAHLSSATDLIALPYLAELKKAGLLTIHGIWPFDRKDFMDPYYLRFYANKIHVASISKSMLENECPAEFISEGYVYNGLNLSDFTFNPKPKNYLTWLGKINPRKGTAEAIRIAKKSGHQIIFAGAIDLQDKESYEYYKNEVEPLIDGDQVKYLGEADLAMKAELLKNAKGFLNPLAWEEPFGLVMIEAMAGGTPVIAYPRGAAKELVKDGINGYLVPDAKAMLQKIKELDKIDRLTCRKYVQDNFSSESNAANYFQIYKKLVDQQAQKAVNTKNKFTEYLSIGSKMRLGISE
jgi:glycosyltransferase involved in cell wall biosynthesis